MAKTDKLDDLIPAIQTPESLLALADSLESMAGQIRFAASQLGKSPVEVVSTPTFRRSYGFVLNWVGNLFQAVSSLSLENAARAGAAKIKSTYEQVSPKEPPKEPAAQKKTRKQRG